jgi:hypothetical protein
MDNPEIKAPAPADASLLQAQFEDLQHLVISVLILLVVVSGTLSVYLLRQWRTTSKDLAAVRLNYTQFINEYHKVGQPRMDAFLDKLKEYGRTHPDFVPILTRYGLSSNVPAGMVPGPSTNLPSSAPKK